MHDGYRVIALRDMPPRGSLPMLSPASGSCAIVDVSERWPVLRKRCTGAGPDRSFLTGSSGGAACETLGSPVLGLSFRKEGCKFGLVKRGSEGSGTVRCTIANEETLGVSGEGTILNDTVSGTVAAAADVGIDVDIVRELSCRSSAAEASSPLRGASRPSCHPHTRTISSTSVPAASSRVSLTLPIPFHASPSAASLLISIADIHSFIAFPMPIMAKRSSAKSRSASRRDLIEMSLSTDARVVVAGRNEGGNAGAGWCKGAKNPDLVGRALRADGMDEN
jgi:hypothetical protein